jgi:hypothetical protein
MRTTCLLLSRGFASLAVALALLAVLTTGGTVFADDCPYCGWSCEDCGQLAEVGMAEMMDCYAQCDGQGLSDSVCDNGCHGTTPACNGACDKIKGCSNYSCVRVPIPENKCECKAGA